MNPPVPVVGLWTSLPTRFLSRISIDARGCMLWMGYRNPSGYGMVHVKRRPRLAHRVAFEALRGEVPSGLQLDHLCRRPACVNPDHLQVVTNWQNTLRTTSSFALKAVSTHCVYGHPFDDENTIVESNGRRRCRACNKAWQRDRYRRKKEARHDPQQTPNHALCGNRGANPTQNDAPTHPTGRRKQTEPAQRSEGIRAGSDQQGV